MAWQAPMNTNLGSACVSRVVVVSRRNELTKAIHQERRKSESCSHAAVRRLALGLIASHAGASFTIRLWMLSVECRPLNIRRTRKTSMKIIIKTMYVAVAGVSLAYFTGFQAF